MENFLKENWIWIVGPILAVVIAVAILLFLSDSDPASEFIYNIH